MALDIYKCTQVVPIDMALDIYMCTQVVPIDMALDISKQGPGLRAIDKTITFNLINSDSIVDFSAFISKFLIKVLLKLSAPA